MRRRSVLLSSAIAGATLASAVLPAPRLLVWNTTASVPTGLYLINRPDELRLGERVAITPPEALARLLAERGYVPSGVPLIKDLAALEGQTVCRSGEVVTIDGVPRARARVRDTLGRTLPVWAGCRTLRGDEIFVLNTHAPGSFDGRYFGPLARNTVIGIALPIWTKAASHEARWLPAASISPPSPSISNGDDQ